MSFLMVAGCRSKTSGSEKGSQSPPVHARFVPTGADPAVALDTETGRLCRTVPADWFEENAPEPGKYVNLPICTAAEHSDTSSMVSTGIDASAWEKYEVVVTCPPDKTWEMYPVEKPGKKQVTINCTIRNRTDRNLPFGARPPRFEAVIRAGSGSAVRPEQKIYLASSNVAIPARGQIEGGLFVDHTCETAVPNLDCFEAGLQNAKELLLTDLNTGIHYRVWIANRPPLESFERQ